MIIELLTYAIVLVFIVILVVFLFNLASACYIYLRYGKPGIWLLNIRSDNRELYNIYRYALTRREQIEVRYIANTRAELENEIKTYIKHNIEEANDSVTVKSIEC